MANVSLLFATLPYRERFAAARAAGFDGVETWWPFSEAAPSRSDLDDFVAAVRDAGVELCGLNFFAGDMPAGERGVACRAERADELVANTAAVLHIAEATGCRRFNLLYGQVPEGESAVAAATAAESYRRAAQALAPLGGTVLVEPLARGLNGAYPLTTHQQVLDLLTGPLQGVPGLALLLDTFHLAMNGVELGTALREAATAVGHVQVADAPGRGEPGSGGLDWATFFTGLRDIGYVGPVGLEYKPTTETVQSLSWVTPDQG